MSPPTRRSGGPPQHGHPAPERSSRHHSAEDDYDGSASLEVLVAAHTAADRLVRAAHVLHRGPFPAVQSPEWLDACWVVQAATLCVLGEAWLCSNPERALAERFREMSHDLSGALDWTAVSRRPSFAELRRRRAEPGRLWRPFDAAAAARWVQTGSSTPEVSAV